MCYNVAALAYRKLRYALRIGASDEDIAELEREYQRLKEKYAPVYFANSFGFPEVPIHRNTEPMKPVMAGFSLIPRFSKTRSEADTHRRKYRTANVTIEKIKGSRMYKDVLAERYCIVVIDGFFEYHHHAGKAHPYFVYHYDAPLLLPGLWDEWVDPETGEVLTTCNIITQPGRGFMEVLHNNPKRPDARMPIILRSDLGLEVLNDFNMVLEHPQDIAIPTEELAFHAVGKLTGKDSIGNSPEAHEPTEYDTLEGSELLDYLV